ncbi:mammalian cell entry protein [Mycobacterium decipiens]|uniref:Mammalian cell entry protein n=1 Tax=Mycobacterium decipiens TaxID=1430326 RepID=A0A1X2LXT0_9MYCO|nr:mammalian cell entry protein [Mycobacterium decipiens]OSC42013.1 mammalian cell entry protein [Mycobacterium decipiens]
MEDQQSASGDLTQQTPAESESGTETAAGTDATEAEGDLDEVDAEGQRDAGDAAVSASEADAAGSETTAGEDGGAPVRRSRGRWLAVAVGVAAALFVASGAFAGATVQPYLSDRAAVATKLTVARTAANAITTLWTYTPENMDTLADRAANYLTGDFAAQYRKFVDQIAAPNKQAKITNNTEVTGAAVESLNSRDAVAIVYTNTTTTSPVTKNIPALKYLSYRLFMKRYGGRWLVTRMTTITSLDLTPHL